jgi:EAL domain-containing protein (putative c-di-GMP-specific phosphodiesterase class I)
VRLTVDDFGTGYSSIGHLRRLPVRGLKIERDLVARTTDSEDGRSIVEAILALARALDLEVTAKGVEDGDQVRLLRLLGCDRLQGGHLGEAVPADRFTELHLPR